MLLQFVIITLMRSISQSGLLRISLLCGLVAALPVAASAAKIVLCSSCDPLPIPITLTNNALDQVQPSSTTDGGLALEFVNLTGTIMDDLVFGTTITAGLSTTQQAALVADGDFTCDPGTGLFLSCAVTYAPSTGALTFNYYNVNPPSYLDSPGVVILEDFIGNGFGDTGIPNLGVFTVQLSNWMPDFIDTAVSSDPLYGGPNCTNCINGFAPFQDAYNAPLTVPEPSAALILLTELLLVAGAITLFGRKLKWNKRFDF